MSLDSIIERFKANPYLTLAWVLALIATLGSLYFSEIWGLVPCKLCWEQRIFMYPLVIILAVGLLQQDKHVTWYALPLSLIGVCIAAYHTVMYYLANYLYGVNEFIVTACSGGVSCTSKQVAFLGFISIPLMSFVAFLTINILLLKSRDVSAKPFWKFWR